MDDNQKYDDPYAPDGENGTESTEYGQERQWEDIRSPQEYTPDQEEEQFHYPPVEMETPVYEPDPTESQQVTPEGVPYEGYAPEATEYGEEEEWGEAGYTQEEGEYEAPYGEEVEEVAAAAEAPYQGEAAYEEEAVYEEGEYEAPYGEQAEEVAAAAEAPYQGEAAYEEEAVYEEGEYEAPYGEQAEEVAAAAEAPYQGEAAYEEEAVYEESEYEAPYGEESAAAPGAPYQGEAAYEEEAVYEESEYEAPYGEESAAAPGAPYQGEAVYAEEPYEEEAVVQVAAPYEEEEPYEEEAAYEEEAVVQVAAPYQGEAAYEEEAVYEEGEYEAPYGEEVAAVPYQGEAAYEEAAYEEQAPQQQEAPYEPEGAYQEQEAPVHGEELPYYPPVDEQATAPEPEAALQEVAFSADAAAAEAAPLVTAYDRDEFWEDVESPKGERWLERFGLHRRGPREKVPFYDEEFKETEAGDINEATIATYAADGTDQAPEGAVMANATADTRTLESHEIARPKIQIGTAAMKRLQSAEDKSPVKMQVPEEYQGETTVIPRYFRAVLFAIIVGLLGAGLYATVTWWKHREYGIFCWVIGIAVGFAVVYGSGKHYNWILGTISASVAIIAMCIGRILTYMMDIWFPDIIKIPVSTMDNLNNAVTLFFHELLSLWIVFLLMAGLVAFLVSFRPLPLVLKSPQERATHR